jgi:hypothetical protein
VLAIWLGIRHRSNSVLKFGLVIEASEPSQKHASKCPTMSGCGSRSADMPRCPLLALSGHSNRTRVVRYWTKADKNGFWPALVCPLMTQQRHWLCTAAMVFMPVSAPIKVGQLRRFCRPINADKVFGTHTANGGLLSDIVEEISRDWTGWLGRQDSNRRVAI